MLWWVWGIKQVDLKGGKFVIGNFLTAYEVPVDQLEKLSEHRNRSPNIVLTFNPPTRFGREIRLITRAGKFAATAELLRSLQKGRPVEADSSRP